MRSSSEPPPQCMDASGSGPAGATCGVVVRDCCAVCLQYSDLCGFRGHGACALQLPYTLLTSRQSPARSGKKYAKLVKQAELDAGLSRYEPFIVRSKNLPGMLFCALTGELLNARLEEVKAHLKGRKFGRAKGERRQRAAVVGGVCSPPS